MQGHLEWVSLIPKEECHCGSLTKLVWQMQDLKNQIGKMENVVYQSKLKLETAYISVQYTA